MSKPSSSMFQSFKEGQMNVWKQVFERLDQLESKQKDLERRIIALEGG